MRRVPCRLHGLWDQRDLQCLSLPGGSSARSHGSQTHITPSRGVKCLPRTQ